MNAVSGNTSNDVDKERPRDVTRSITVCADDFGMNDGVDLGIIALAGAGRLGAVSILSTGPSLRTNIAGLDGQAAQLGLHLNFTESFGRAGVYFPLTHLIARAYLRHLDESLIRSQVDRQLDAFEDIVGRPPDYIDGHQHVHQLPQIRDALIASLRRRYRDSGIWVRGTRAPAGIGTGFGLKSHIISSLGGSALAHMLARDGVKTNRRLFGVYDFKGGAITYATLLRIWMTAMQAGDLLMCHPALRAGKDALGRQRVAEFDVLKEDEFAQLLTKTRRRAASTS